MRRAAVAVCSSLIMLLASSPRAAAEPAAIMRVKEWLGIDWPATWLTFAVELPGVAAAELQVVDDTGKHYFHQLSHIDQDRDGRVVGARLHLRAGLPADQTLTLMLLPQAPPPRASALRLERSDDYLTLVNSRIKVRLPAETENRHGALRGPIEGIQLLDGSWTAPATINAVGPGSYSVQVLAEGPLFAEAAVRYQFADGSWHRVVVRLFAGEDVVRVDETGDTGRTERVRQWHWALPLCGDSFRPNVGWWATPDSRLPERDDDVEAALDALGFGDFDRGDRKFGSGRFSFTEARQVLREVNVWYPYRAAAHYLGLGQLDRLAGDPARVPFLGIVPLHGGNWRGMPEGHNGELVGLADGSVRLEWPLTVSPHPNSLLHTGEYDPDHPYTFVRRQWAIVGGAVRDHAWLHDFRLREGYVNLDDYKDWVLEWPRDAAITYPRLLTNRAHLERLEPQLDDHPGAATLRQFLYFNEDQGRLDSLYARLTTGNDWESLRGHLMVGLGRSRYRCAWNQGFRHSQRAAWAGDVDELLASEALTDEQRLRLRALVAACCNLLAEPDFNPRGMMSHLGNPNMPINRFFGLTFAAALIPDHPRAGVWLDVSAAYLRYKLAMNTAPNDAWSELITYYMAAASHLMQAAAVLHASGRLDPASAQMAACVGRFPLYLLTPPDPRFGARALPGWGHEGSWMIPTQWLPVAMFCRDRDRALARDMVWGWDQLGRPVTDHHDAGFSQRAIIHADLLRELPPDYVPERFGSRWLPGFGATMRAHAGDPNELYLSYRQGYLVSHSDANQGDFVLYAKGEPLTALSLFQYTLYQQDERFQLYDEFGWHNRIRFGSQDNQGPWPGGGPISQVHRHFSSSAADYLRAVADFPPQRWTRQVLMLPSRQASGPNYLVFRESFAALTDQALERNWWYLSTDGDRSRVTPTETGFCYTAPSGTRLLVLFPDGSPVVESRPATGTGPMYNRAAELWQQTHPELGTQGKGSINVSETTTVTAVGPFPPRQDYWAVLYPAFADEAPPRCEVAAAGVLRVHTSEGTDTVFAGSAAFSAQIDDLRFAGLAGVVRQRYGQFELALTEGPGEIGCGDCLLRSAVPAARVFTGDAGPRLVEIVAPEHDLRLRELTAPEQLQAGVVRQLGPPAVYQFAAAVTLDFTGDGVHFRGRRGEVERGADGRVRLLLLDGERIAADQFVVWGGTGPCEVVYEHDRITGRTAGGGHFLYLTRPPGLDRLPALVIDGRQYAPGTSGDFELGDVTRTGDPYDPDARGGILIVPVLPGRHQFEIRALEQPPVFRNWQAWDGATTRGQRR